MVSSFFFTRRFRDSYEKNAMRNRRAFTALRFNPARSTETAVHKTQYPRTLRALRDAQRERFHKRARF